MSRGRFDFTKTGGIRAAAEWLRGKSDGIVVVVIRGEDYAYAVDASCAPSDAAELVEDLLPQMVEDANRRRAEKREAQTRKRAAESHPSDEDLSPGAPIAVHRAV